MREPLDPVDALKRDQAIFSNPLVILFILAHCQAVVEELAAGEEPTCLQLFGVSDRLLFSREALLAIDRDDVRELLSSRSNGATREQGGDE